MKKRFPKNSDCFDKYLDPCGQQGVFKEAVFRFILRRERERVDRAGGRFSLVEFRLPASHCKSSESWIINLVAKRIRITDSIGWLSASSIGVLLLNTRQEGAHTFLAPIVSEITEVGSVPDIQIYTYPETPQPGEKVRSESSSSPSSVQSSAEPFDMFFEEILSIALPRFGQFFERLTAGLVLVLLSPLFLLISLGIKLSSPGPVFFRQERVGYMGKPFFCYKFRTMHLNADTDVHEKYFKTLIETNAPMQKLDARADPRIFRLACFLRSSSLDELPQLVNILRGEMRFIGPRPAIPGEYREYLPWHRHRIDVRPGLTGLWQVNGKNKTTFTEMMRFDLRYSLRRSLRMDFRIILKTFPVILSELKNRYFRRGIRQKRKLRDKKEKKTCVVQRVKEQ